MNESSINEIIYTSNQNASKIIRSSSVGVYLQRSGRPAVARFSSSEKVYQSYTNIASMRSEILDIGDDGLRHYVHFSADRKNIFFKRNYMLYSYIDDTFIQDCINGF